MANARFLLRREGIRGSWSAWLLYVGGALIVAAPQGCLLVEPDLNYCANVNGDFFCKHRHGAAGPSFCLSASSACLGYAPDPAKNDPDFDGCIDVRPGEDVCYSPCGQGQSFIESSSCLEPPGATDTDAIETSATTMDASTATMTTEAVSADGTTLPVDSTTDSSTPTSSTSSSSTGEPPECAVDDDCAGNTKRPFCDTALGMCVTCTALEGDETCATADPTHPICLMAVCVACTSDQPEACTVDMHVCDPMIHECVPCNDHEDCGIGACHIFEGTCFPDTSYVFMINDQGHDIQEEILDIPAGGFGIVMLSPLPVGDAYDDITPIVIDGGRTVAILNPVAPEKSWIRNGSNPASVVAVDANSTLYLQGLRIAEHGDPDTIPLRCSGPSARLDARGVSISDNAAGTNLSDCEARLENCFLQSLDDDTAALNVGGDSNVNVNFTTMVTDDGDAFGMNAVAACTSNSELLIRNSLILSQGGGIADPEISAMCNSMVLEHSIIESAPDGGLSNDTLEPPFPLLGPNYANWFCNFNAGDLHLDTMQITSDLATVMENLDHLEIAVPSTGDSDIDIDGEYRSMSAMIGADVPGSCP